MSVQSKDVDSFWLQKIKYPFSTGKLPWGAGKKHPHSSRVSVRRDIPDETKALLWQFCGNNEDSLRIVFITLLKLVLYNYLEEKNIYIMGFKRQGAYLFTTPVEVDGDLRRLLLRVRDDFDEMSAIGPMDPGNMIDKYRIRLGHKADEEFYKFALEYPDVLLPEQEGCYDFVCRITDTPKDGAWVTMSYWPDAAYAPGFLDLLVENFIHVCSKVREWSDHPVNALDIRCPEDQQLSALGKTKGPLDETGREVPVGAAGRMGEDRVRRRPDGTIEYLGKVDRYIKVNGFPVQLEQVENRIQETGRVREVVVVSGRQKENECLCAYLEALEKVDIPALQEELSLYLPHYMVPALFMQLDRIPTAPNGEKMRKDLPKISRASKQDGDGRPKTARELVVEDIWKQIFGLSAAAASEGFYELGGDSIKAIQMRSKLAARGFTISIKDILDLNDLEAIALAMQEERGDVAEQTKIAGETALTPIQSDHLRENWPSRDHLNQSILLDLTEDPGEETIREIFEKLMDHHDTLRLTITGSQQTYRGVIEKEVSAPVTYHNLRGVPSAETFLEEETLRIQRGLQISRAPMMAVVLFRQDYGTKLLLVIHHLLIDGVSWRVLMEDFKTLYDQKRQGQPLKLPLKTQSLGKWNELILDKAVAGALKELDHWTVVCRRSQDLFRLAGEKNAAGNFSTVGFSLGGEDGQALNGAARITYTTSTEDLLLAAFCMAMQQIYGCSKLLMSAERHGRDACGPQADVSRSVGWFTSVFPVAIEWPANGDMRELILAVKNSLRVTPGSGAGYGILRYFVANKRKLFHDLAYTPDVEFNYLGEFSNTDGGGLFTVASYSPGEQMGEAYLHRAPLIVNAFLTEDHSIHISLLYNIRFLAGKDVNQLALSYRKYLEEVIGHCLYLSRRYDIEEIYPLTPLQEGILFHHLVSGDPTVYFEQVSFHYNGELQHEALFASLDSLSRRHQLLRSAYIHSGTERPVQIILKDARIKRNYEDISDLTEAQQEQYILRFKQADRGLGFRPEEGPLLRLHLLRLSGWKYCFIWSFHHLIMDGWSLDIVSKELFTLYSSLIRKSPDALMPAPNFKAFIDWLGRRDKDGDRDYWSAYLAGYQDRITIPGARLAGGRQKLSVLRTVDLEDSYVNGLRQIAAARHITVNGLIQAAWAVLLGRYNHSHDVTFGLIVSGRPSEITDVERMVGMFINAIPRRVSFGEVRDILTLARKVQEDAVDSLKHSHYPLATLQKDLGIRGELFDHILNYISYPLADRIKILKEKGTDVPLQISDIEVFERTHYDFTVSVIDYAGITLKFDYTRYRYDEAVMEELFDSFLYIIRQIAGGTTDLDQLKVISKAQERRLVVEFNKTETKFDKPAAIQQLFEAQAAGTPDAIALVYGQTVLDYRMLNEEANRLAFYLRKNHAINAGDLLAVMLDRSQRLIITVMGILKSGAAYVPIDVDYPQERIDFIVKDTQCKVIIDESWFSAFMAERESCEGNNPVLTRSLHDPAYVIYTSGSTGNPKGVIVEHSSVINLILSQRQEFGITADENILLFSSISFDASVEQLFLALTSGARLTLIDKGTLLDAGRLERLIDDSGITHIHFVPGILKMLSVRKYTRLKRVIAGGDRCPREIADSWAGYYPFYNEYGPTETTVTSIEWRHDPVQGLSFVPVGRPIANTRVYLLDGLSLSPVGAIGEICIGGAGVARGYLNREVLTREKFISNPLLDGDRIYRTGDLGRWTDDGVIEFIGRIDHQVKVRGYRVEPGEIENRLLQAGKLTDAYVCIHAGEGKIGQEKLVAYLVAKEPVLDIAVIKEYLAASLPAYMIPSYFIQLPQLPLTRIGKVDLAALPVPGETAPAGTGNAEQANDTRKRLIEIWAEVLGIRQPGTSVNFFDLGATSIDLMIASGKIKKYFDIDDLLVKIFHYPSIDLLAGYIDRVQDGGGQETMAEATIDGSDVRNRRQRRRNLKS